MEDCKSRLFYVEPIKIRKLREVYQNYTYFAENDLLLAKIANSFENGKMSIAKNLKNEIGFGSTEFIVLRAKESVLIEWVYYCLRSSDFIQAGKETIRGTAHQRIDSQFVGNYSIFVPPFEIQKKFIEEIKQDEKDKEHHLKFIRHQEEKRISVLDNLWKSK